MLKHLKKHWSTALLLIVILILIVPAWRIKFQGWVQGIFMQDVLFTTTEKEALPEQVYEWNLTELGETETSFSTKIDRPILMSFWATWCPPCRAELKQIKSLQEKFGSKIHFISVSEETEETIVKSGLDEYYDFLYSTKRYPDFFNVSVYPTLVIIDSEGNLVYRHEGAGGLDNEKNESFLNALLEKG